MSCFAIICANLLGEPRYSHDKDGERYFKFRIGSERKSGVWDFALCVAPERIVESMENNFFFVFSGSICTRWVAWKDNTQHIETLFEIDSVMPIHDRIISANSVFVEGVVFKTPVLRKTPTGKTICDIIITSQNENHTNYIHCLAWGFDAVSASKLEVGESVFATGRFQSRDYVKVLENGNRETRTAYEVCIFDIEKI